MFYLRNTHSNKLARYAKQMCSVKIYVNMLSKSKFVNVARQHDSTTANGAVTHSTSLHSVVDLFFLAGASRNMEESEILSLWARAYAEDKSLALKCLFWARDVRGWAGERRFFRTIWNSLDKEDIKRLESFVAEYGRYDDLHETSLDYLVDCFWDEEKLNKSLLCKWIPRKGKVFEYIRKKLGLVPKVFRQLLVKHTNVVEQLMSAKERDAIEYAKVPSQAFQKYKKAFQRNDEARFTMFITEDADKIKAGTLFPYQLYQSYNKNEDKKVIDEQRKNLPNYVTEGKSFLPVCDVSGSMTSGYGNKSLTPMDISVSLGVYLSERNKSVFKDAFITFSDNPKMEYLTGTATQRFRQLETAHRDGSTNLQAVFSLILMTALKNNLTVEDMPENIIIISDMEFNECAEHTNYERVEDQYKESWYKMPNLVFWNVNGRPGNSPVAYDEKGTALVSGASPAIIKSLLGWEDMTPVGIMNKALLSERYAPIN